MEDRRPNQTITGVVVSDKMDKTVVVLVNRLVKHPVYKKYIRRRAKFMAHDEKNSARLGDTVEIIQSRPLSRLKRWRLTRILARQA
ncbi:MAG: 30S ribosomal protein S17 [Deltaproteobacteria bacterium]|nr:30S ribosomal protein S17 [Deltaproteobacteria bacterium]MDR2141208.1 30S ribosomal protein S17 [Deltaproteobacteria bacterium]MDR2422655.1 30S ribosomal protein S17 [Deltaproteobacteria bacterium]